MISSIIRALFSIKILPNISEQEKKQQRICDLLHAETKSVSLYTVYKAKKNLLQKRGILRKRGMED